MPYKSLAQMKKFHALLAEGKISKETVDKFDKESAGKRLPDRVNKKKITSVKQLRQIRESLD